MFLQINMEKYNQGKNRIKKGIRNNSLYVIGQKLSKKDNPSRCTK